MKFDKSLLTVTLHFVAGATFKQLSLELPKIISDNMELQRNKAVIIWRIAKQNITVKFKDQRSFKALSQLQDKEYKSMDYGLYKIEHIFAYIEVADPNICLSAIQYSILDHEDAVDRLLSAVKKAGVKLVSGVGCNSGFLG